MISHYLRLCLLLTLPDKVLKSTYLNNNIFYFPFSLVLIACTLSSSHGRLDAVVKLHANVRNIWSLKRGPGFARWDKSAPRILLKRRGLLAVTCRPALCGPSGQAGPSALRSAEFPGWVLGWGLWRHKIY